MFRLFGVSGACAACAQQIPASELVMRTHNKVYHLKCFSCSSCHIQLVPGDRYTLINGSLVCENDHSKLFKAHGMTTVAGFRPGNKVCTFSHISKYINKDQLKPGPRKLFEYKLLSVSLCGFVFS